MFKLYLTRLVKYNRFKSGLNAAAVKVMIEVLVGIFTSKVAFQELAY